jgi:hypothetical protein
MEETMGQGVGVHEGGPVATNEFVGRGINPDGQDFGGKNIPKNGMGNVVRPGLKFGS